MRSGMNLLLVLCVVAVSACSTKISGFVKLVDQDAKPIAGDTPESIVVNMINTSVPIDQASVSATTLPDGSFTTKGTKIEPGLYKLEVSRIGYTPTTTTMEVKKFRNNETELFLRRIAEGKRSSIRNLNTDENKIINPGEVNIQPPSM